MQRGKKQRSKSKIFVLISPVGGHYGSLSRQNCVPADLHIPGLIQPGLNFRQPGWLVGVTQTWLVGWLVCLVGWLVGWCISTRGV